MTDLFADIIGEVEASLHGPPAEITDERRIAALLELARQAKGGDPEANRVLAELRSKEPSLYEIIVEACADPEPMDLYRPAERAVESGEIEPGIDETGKLKTAPEPSLGAYCGPIGSDGKPLDRTPPSDPRIGELQALFSSSKRLRRKGWPRGWEKVFTSHGETDHAWRLIAAGMRPQESAVDFIARCFAGQVAAGDAEGAMARTRRMSAR